MKFPIDYKVSKDKPVMKVNAKAKINFFPSKLYKLLNEPRNHDIIRWIDHGRSWKIIKKERLSGVLKKYFKHGNVQSFIRSVNGWGFTVGLHDFCHEFI